MQQRKTSLTGDTSGALPLVPTVFQALPLVEDLWGEDESLSCTCTHRGAFFPLLYIFSNMAQAAHFAPASHRLCIVAQQSELAATGAAAFLVQIVPEHEYRDRGLTYAHGRAIVT